MDPKKIRHRWTEIKRNKHIDKEYRKGWLLGLLGMSESMEEGAFTAYMEACLGDEWTEILEAHDLMKEAKDG